MIVPEYTMRATVSSVPGLSNVEYQRGEEGYHSMDEYKAYMSESIAKSKIFGAELVMFAEEAFFIMKDWNDTMVDTLKELAVENEVNIMTGVDIYGDDTHMWNSMYFVGKDGELKYYYVKHHPVPSVEDGYERSRHKITSFEVPFFYDLASSKLSSIICYDINFDFFVNWVAFKEHPDILLVPSWDYEAVADYQTQVAKYRAIENGFSIIKNTIAGTTLYTDFCGRVTTFYQVEKEDSEYFIVNGVYLEGRKTLYSFIGIFWNYFYIIGVIIVVFVKSGLFDKKKDKETDETKKLNSNAEENKNSHPEEDQNHPASEREHLKESELTPIKADQVEVGQEKDKMKVETDKEN